MAAIGAVVGAVGTVLSGVAGIASAQAQSDALEAQAAERERQADEERAAAQREAARIDRDKRRLVSTAQARAAASGGGATDATVTRVVGGIGQEGTYAARGAVYEGERRGQALEAQANIDRMRARNARIQGYAGAFSSILGGVSTFADRWDQFRPRSGSGYYI